MKIHVSELVYIFIVIRDLMAKQTLPGTRKVNNVTWYNCVDSMRD